MRPTEGLGLQRPMPLQPPGRGEVAVWALGRLTWGSAYLSLRSRRRLGVLLCWMASNVSVQTCRHPTWWKATLPACIAGFVEFARQRLPLPPIVPCPSCCLPCPECPETNLDSLKDWIPVELATQPLGYVTFAVGVVIGSLATCALTNVVRRHGHATDVQSNPRRIIWYHRL